MKRVIETDRLLLRKLTLDDDAFILELLNDSAFLRFIGDKGVRTLEDARDYILTGPVASYERHGFGLFLTALKESGVSIGICGLLKREALENVDVGFAFLPQFWRKGYATESAAAVLEYGKTVLGIDCIVAIVSADNHVSIKVLKKLGMCFEKMAKLSEDAEACALYAPEGL